MSILKVKTVEHTIAPHGGECITQEWTYPRAIHAEIMTHRMLSRNAESSRAVPVLKKLEKTSANTWIPEAFTRNQKGMQGGTPLEGEADLLAKTIWELSFKTIKPCIEKLAQIEAHKEYVNRLLEPWATITVVVSATDWDNMDALRAHPDAFPEFQQLMWMAIDERMASRHRNNTARYIAEEIDSNGFVVAPLQRNPNNWHLPYVGIEERAKLGLEQSIKCSVARCARVSFLLHDGTTTNIEKDNDLYNRLYSGGHMSPMEHQATPLVNADQYSGNFRGWLQYRKTIANESRKFNYWDACEQAGRVPVVPRP